MHTKSLNNSQPWLGNATQEIWLILAPAIFPVLAIFIFQDYFTTSEVNTLWWVVLVLFIDVGHVYSTLFRMYWDKPTFVKYKSLLIIIPLAGFFIGFCLHLYSANLFWRVLAYVAIYHFVRQQYGFMRLYSRQENKTTLIKRIDDVTIYAATLYPVLYWHLHLTNRLSWFIQGDLIPISSFVNDSLLFWIYISIITTYCVKEIVMSIKNNSFNIPKNMIVIGTCLSWYVGIITFQGDLIFTLLNVVAHGIPYMGLIWIHGRIKNKVKEFSFSLKGVFIFIIVLFLLAYLEESFWDVLVWKDHLDVFPFFESINPIQNPIMLSAIVSLLVLPQLTHYVLDGFIWRFSKDKESRI